MKKSKNTKRELAIILLILFLLLLFLTQKSNLKTTRVSGAGISIIEKDLRTEIEIEPDSSGVDKFALLYQNNKLVEIINLGYQNYVGFEKKTISFSKTNGGKYTIAVYFYSKNDWVKKEFSI